MELEYESKYPLYITYVVPILLAFPLLSAFPLLNKGSAFPLEERDNFNLHGLLPNTMEAIEGQAECAWR